MSALTDADRMQLLSARALIDRVLDRDDAARDVAGTGAQAGAQEPGDCTHPEEARIDSARMGHPSDWICGSCPYRYCPEEGSDQ